MFYNTTSEQGDLLKSLWAKSERQEDVVLEFFKSNPDKTFTPTDVWSRANWADRPLLTSVRRCISDLTKSGKIVKLEEKRMGRYGMSNHTWKYNL